MTSYRQSMKDTLELMNLMREAKLLERDLTPDEEKRREEIAKKLSDDDFKKRYGDKWMQVKMATATNMVKKEEFDLEETELDEGVIDKVKEVASKKQAMKIDGVMVDTFTASAISQIYDKVNDANKKKMDSLPITKLANLAMKMMQKNEFVPEGKMQDVWQKKNAKSLSVGSFELIRGKSGVHTIKQSGKVIGDFSYDSDADNFVANMKGMKGQWTGNDIDSLFTHLQKVHKEEIEEASAAADARRAMRRDPDMKQRAFSKDDSASDDDKKAASKNIIMQMRKAQSLKGRFDVEFQDGKKVKIPAKMAIAVQNKYNSLPKPADKEKFQAKIGKSYRDMLNALKESEENPDYKAGGKSKADEYRSKAKKMVGTEAVSPAQQAAIAISKKERGEKPKKESILDRIDRKIKENKNG